MKLQYIKLSNFQSFGETAIKVALEDITYLIGPNGSGKTVILQALCRLFGFDPSLRKIQRSDFHVPHNEQQIPDERQLWIEANFIFPELNNSDDMSTIAPHFAHMRIDSPEGVPRVRFLLNATMGLDGDIEESLVYVLDVDDNNSPLTTAPVSRLQRNQIHIHYLPARRDPADHITYGTNALLGRMLRAVNWDIERDAIKNLTGQISESLATNLCVNALSDSLQNTWNLLHKGMYFSNPKITFVASEIESLLRHLSVSFTPGHGENMVDFSRLSDGQKSMLYLSLVLSSQMIGRDVLAGKDYSFDPEKLRPPVFTLIAIEEPENSLSPYYLGRIINSIESMTRNNDAQALIATHAPSMLRRVNPQYIRYLRIAADRTTQIRNILLPDKNDDAHKFVREAVQACPEIYFARLVVLGEGASEEIILAKILQAQNMCIDESSITIAPLGGRHVNHFWRLLTALEIPHVTLLDLDVARYQGGWGRIKYVNDQLNKFRADDALSIDIPHWNGPFIIRDAQYQVHFHELESKNIFFSQPMDIDFAMIMAYPEAYNVENSAPTQTTIKAVLGKSHLNPEQYAKNETLLFDDYHKYFQLGSKPSTHIEAFSKLNDEAIIDKLPPYLERLVKRIGEILSELPE